MGINPARRAAIRVLGSGCFGHVGVLALERNNSTQFTPASKAGLLVEGTVRKNWTACLEPRGLRPKAAEKRLVLQAVGHMGRRRCRSHWLFDQLKFPRRGETIPAVLQNSRDDLQRPLCNVDGRVGGSSAI